VTPDRIAAIRREAARRLDPEMARYAPIAEFLREVAPDDLERLDPEAYVPGPRLIGAGVDLREEQQLELLRSWADHQDLFDLLRANPEVNTLTLGRPYLHNTQYPTPDAEVYAAVIASQRPSRILEIGAGFSTRIARQVVDALALDTEIVVVDPQPRADVTGRAKVIPRRIEELEPASLGLGPGTLLFVDSSHIVRAGGDVPFIFCGLMPSLSPGTVVHVHDVFLPYDYPDAYRRRLYGEQYVLWALLARSSVFRVLFATHLMSRRHTAPMQEVFGAIVGSDDRHFGASFWLEITDSSH
jgi:hypothetical protein